MMRSIVIVGSAQSTLRLLIPSIKESGYALHETTDFYKALDLLTAYAPYIVMIDAQGMEAGLVSFCKAVRSQEGVNFAYVMVSMSTGCQDDRVAWLDAGADEVIRADCHADEVMARIRAAERIVRLERSLAQKSHALVRTNAEYEVTNHRLQMANEKLEKASDTDGLTGLHNRQAAMKQVEQAIARAKRQREPLSCITFGIDRFSVYNDRYGLLVGDHLLKETAQCIDRFSRFEESVYRIGGEEFMVLCPGTTGQMAYIAAERLRCAVETNAIQYRNDQISVTVSGGVAAWTEPMTEPDQLFSKAGEAVRLAKESGRNRIMMAEESSRLVTRTWENEETFPMIASDGDLRHDRRKSPRVLVVDDDESFCRLCRQLLEDEGFTVDEVVNGIEALKHIDHRHPDVILLDALMPEMDGYECARQLKADPKTRDIPLIMVSSQAETDDILTGLEAGVDDYITKPINHREFILRVQSMARLHLDRLALLRSNRIRSEQARTLSLMLDLSRSLAQSNDIDLILERIMLMTIELTGSRRVLILLPDEKNPDVLRMVGAIGYETVDFSQACFSVESGVVGEVFRSGRSITINSEIDAVHYDLNDGLSVIPSVETPGSIGEEPTPPGKSDERLIPQLDLNPGWPMMLSALSTSDHMIGVMIISERYGRRPFMPYELEMIDLISNIAASSIDDLLMRQARDEAHESIVFALAKLAEHRDDDTGKHLDRVTQYCLILADYLRSTGQYDTIIDEQFMGDLEQSVPLHDIGKVAIPDSILLKPGKLTDAEMDIMRRHTTVGWETIHSVNVRTGGAGFLRMAEDIAHCHHERFDGYGYPRGMKGNEIPLCARIVALADVYDALTTKRVYKDAMSHDKARSILLEGDGTQFDPDIIAAFSACEDRFIELHAELSDHPTPVLVDESESESNRAA